MNQHTWTEPVWKPQRPKHVPLDVLPPEFAQYVEATSKKFQIDAGFTVILALSVLAAATRGRCTVNAVDDWHEPLSFYAAPMLPSGSRKSAAMTAVSKPLTELETHLLAEALPRHAQQQSDLRIATQRLAKAEKMYAETPTPKNRQLLEDARNTEMLCQVQPLPRFMVDDATAEAMATILAEQGSVALLTTEGGTLANFTGDRYSNGTPNLNVLLQAHAGEPIKVNRKGSPPLHVENPHLVMCIAAQPDVLREMNQSAEMKARGVHSRFIFLLPESNLGDRELRPPTVAKHLVDMWAERVQNIAKNDSRRILQLKTDAQDELLRVQDYAERKCGNQDTDWLSGWFSKLAGTTVRIAALLALFDDPHATSVNAECMRAAAGLINWLEAHALAADSMKVPTQKETVLRQMRRWDGKADFDSRTFTTRDMHQVMKHRKWVQIGGVEAVEFALHELAADGWCRPLPMEYRTGRPSQRWEWHPQLHHYWEQQTKMR